MANITFHVNESYHRWLAQMDLLSFERLMFTDIGTVIGRDGVRDIRRITGGGKVAYLKRRLVTPIPQSLETYLLGRRAHTVPFGEYLHVRSLQQFGLPVMKVIAASERRAFGFPCHGFILVREVKGISMDALLRQAIPPERRTKLLQSLGRLLARLHLSGFFASVRLKDVVVTDGQAEPLVLIDREARHWGPRRRLKFRARQALRRSFRRTIRDCPFFSEHHRAIVIRAYEDHVAAAMGAAKTRLNPSGIEFFTDDAVA